MASADPGHASAEAIRFHYDVGTEFYRLWLDPTLTYSAALWEGDPPSGEDAEAAALHHAQLRKLDHAIALSGARGARRALDVGCGWGSLLARMVEAHGVERAVGLTLSADQARHVTAQRWPGVEVALQSFAEHRPEVPYDALACIGAFEHFARPELSAAHKLAAYRGFFAWCHGVLAPQGRMYLQTIAYGSAERAGAPTFLQREIFPQSDLPRLSEICAAADGRFEIVRVDNHREHYAQTAKLWDRRLRRARTRAAELTSRETVQRYSQYLRLAAIGFHTGALALYRIGLRRI